MDAGERGRAAGHVVLVGLPGAGKSTVGPLVAARLGRPFLDLDLVLVARDGRPIARQFAEDGEAAFRRREALLSAELATAEPHVLAPGGGWLTNDEAARALRPGATVVYLRTAPAAALARMGHGAAARPLLAGDDPLAALAALLDRRRSAYESADRVVDVDGHPAVEVAERIVAALVAWPEDGTPPSPAPAGAHPPGDARPSLHAAPAAALPEAADAHR